MGIFSVQGSNFGTDLNKVKVYLASEAELLHEILSVNPTNLTLMLMSPNLSALRAVQAIVAVRGVKSPAALLKDGYAPPKLEVQDIVVQSPVEGGLSVKLS